MKMLHQPYSHMASSQPSSWTGDFPLVLIIASVSSSAMWDYEWDRSDGCWVDIPISKV